MTYNIDFILTDDEQLTTEVVENATRIPRKGELVSVGKYIYRVTEVLHQYSVYECYEWREDTVRICAEKINVERK